MIESDSNFNISKVADNIVAEVIRGESEGAEHAVLGKLFEIAVKIRDREDIIDLPQNRRVIGLARSLYTLISDGCLTVEGKYQREIWSVGRREMGEDACGVLWVGPDFGEEYMKRPESMRAEMLFNMADAAFMDSRNRVVGSFKSLDEVGEVIAAYLKTFPAGLPMTDSQKYLIGFGK
jgi:hypothetical protein